MWQITLTVYLSGLANKVSLSKFFLHTFSVVVFYLFEHHPYTTSLYLKPNYISHSTFYKLHHASKSSDIKV